MTKRKLTTVTFTSSSAKTGYCISRFTNSRPRHSIYTPKTLHDTYTNSFCSIAQTKCHFLCALISPTSRVATVPCASAPVPCLRFVRGNCVLQLSMQTQTFEEEREALWMRSVHHLSIFCRSVLKL